jgi:hypothetical protein
MTVRTPPSRDVIGRCIGNVDVEDVLMERECVSNARSKKSTYPQPPWSPPRSKTMTALARVRLAVEFRCGWKLIVRPLVIMVLTATFCLAVDQALWEGKTGPFYSSAVVWSGAKLTEPNLRLFYMQLSQRLRENRAWTADVFVDQNDGFREYYGLIATEANYKRWADLYTRFGRKLLPMAEIQSSGGDAVLRLRDDAGVCSETVFSGRDFLRANVNKVQFEILKIYYRSLPPHTKATPGDEAMISVYVRASTLPTAEQAREFSVSMQRRFLQRRVMVKFRADAFFLTDGMFPIMYRFDPRATPPSQEEYEKSKTLYCFCDQPGIPCR